MKSRSVFLVFFGVGLIAVTAWQVRRSTSASQLQSSHVAVTGPSNDTPKVIAEGRLMPCPGARVAVRSEVLGTIASMSVLEKAEVRRGDLLLELRADDLKAEQAEAGARLLEAQTSLKLAQSEEQRGERLRTAAVSSIEEWDRLKHRTAMARAQLAAYEATLDRIKAQLAKTRILAPIDGTVLTRHVHPGETVEPGALLVTIANLRRVRIEAEVDEFDTGRVAVGDTAKVLAEAFPGCSWTGKVEEIPDHVVDRNLRPEDPGRPSDARVLMVKIGLSEVTPLKLGQRVEVEIACRNETRMRER